MNAITRRSWGWGATLMAAVVFNAEAIVAQPAPSSPSPQDRINELARSFKNKPRLKKLSDKQRENVVNFIVGNMLFANAARAGSRSCCRIQRTLLPGERRTPPTTLPS